MHYLFKSSKIYILAVAGFMAASLVCKITLAQTADDTWQFTAGLAVVNQPNHPGSSTQETSLYPVLNAQKNSFFIGTVPETGIPFGAGAYFVQDKNWTIGAGVGDSIGGNTGQTALGVAFANYHSKYFNATSHVRTDIGGNGQGSLFSMDLYGQIHPSEHLRLTLGPGVTWANSEYTQKFFGVDATQSTDLGLARYAANGGINSVSITFGASYRLTRHWDIGTELTASSLRGDAGDSPLTKSKSQDSATLFVIRSF